MEEVDEARRELEALGAALATARELLEAAQQVVDGALGKAPHSARAAASAAPDSTREQAHAAREEIWAWALTDGPTAGAAQLAANDVDALLEAAADAERNGGLAEARVLHLRALTRAEAAVAEASRPQAARSRRSG